MTRDQIMKAWPGSLIEFTDDNKAYIHAGGAYPLILDILIDDKGEGL